LDLNLDIKIKGFGIVSVYECRKAAGTQKIPVLTLPVGQ
jgi:hypothetical protein